MSLKSTLASILGGKAKRLSARELDRIRAAAEKEEKDAERDEESTSAMDGEDEDEDQDGDTDTADPADPDEDGDAEKDDDEDGDGPEARVLRRVAAITGCKEARGREKLASKLAATPGMTVAQARALLRAAPKSSALAAQMAGQDPAIAADGGTAASDDDDPIAAFIAAGQGHRLVESARRKH